MPTRLCNNGKGIVAQTLFLGASVSSFNNSVGWGGQPSQLTVNLVEDETPCPDQFQFASHSKNAINHYHDCVGDDCFIKPDGTDYNGDIDRIEDRMIPGKVYYSIDKTYSSPIVSNYWRKSDPGFFGRKTRIRPDGTEETNPNISYQYDIINTPVYFKDGDFSFCGLVQSWNRDLSSGGKNYTVAIQSMQSLLNSSYLIVDKYAGAIFSKKSGSFYGAPKNYLKDMGVTYNGTISEGNIPNIFNVYGFMESFGIEGFGPSYVNDRGMPANKIISALNVLTSSLLTGSSNLNTIVDSQAPRRAFSPFGRILAKQAQLDAKSTINNSSLQINNIFDKMTANNFGIISPSSGEYCEFLLDLSEIPNTPDDFRIQGPVISIMDFINTVSEQTGRDIYIDTVPISYNNTVLYVIKVKTISRLSQPRPNIIENTIKEFECNNYQISSETIGKEKNESNGRSLIIGGAQQRLYQAKSYRLAYTQSNFIYDDREHKFIDYMQLGRMDTSSRTTTAQQQFHHGKIKRPNFWTTRNRLLNNTNYSEILEDEDQLQQELSSAFYQDDTEWSDNKQVGGSSTARYNGNYLDTTVVKQDDQDVATWGFSAKQRWFPLHLDVICPFFGFVKEEELTLKVGNDNSTNDLRKVRPVWFDTWTGQLVVVLRIDELPEISVPLESPYNSSFDRCADQLKFNQQHPTVRPLAEVPDDAYEDDGTGSGTNRITRIEVTDPGKYIRGTVKITVSGNSFGQDVIAVANVSNGQLRSIDLRNRGEGFRKGTKATVDIKIIQDRSVGCLPSSNRENRNPSDQFFMLTESEIRAALAGYDNFLVYSLAKYYKPDIITMVRNAYALKIFNRLKEKGWTDDNATFAAQEKTNWYWKQEDTNIMSEAGGSLLPSYLVADKADGSQYLPDDAVHDLQVLHKFITEVGKYYGKKYMVTATNVVSYKDSDFNNIVIPTPIGNAYVFNGAGDIRYNYVPTNDGAWEEYGNFIDDSIIVGGPEWFNLSDEKGKIKPILGYNASKYLDYQRYMICLEQNNAINTYKQQRQVNPYWDFMVYLHLLEEQNINCDTENFIFPLVDTSSLNASDFVLTEVISGNTSVLNAVNSNSTSLPSIDINNLPSSQNLPREKTYDAFGKEINTTKTKLYVNSSVEESFIYLDPDTKNYPKFLIDAPGLILNHSSIKNAQDPARTVIANTSVEDVSIYMRTTQRSQWDTGWITHMLLYTRSFIKDIYSDRIDSYALYRNNSNQSALQVEIAPKAAHPFFVGIPVKSSQATYGPWTNYPYLEYKNDPKSIFPDGKIIVQDTGLPPNCAATSLVINDNSAKKAIDNWITPINIEVKEDFVPWNYGGMSYLDTVAYKEIETKINYESIIETAQVEMPGLPIFNLGGNFSYGNVGLGAYRVNTYQSSFYDNKRKPFPGQISSYATNDLNAYNIDEDYINNSVVSTKLNFTILTISVSDNVTVGPIITNIQTGMSQKGLSTTYSFRTYTRKLGLFNKEESDRIRRFTSENFRRIRQIAELRQEMRNINIQQRKFLEDQRMSESTFGTKDFRSKLYGSSPSKVLIGRNSSYLPEPLRTPERIDNYSLYSRPDSINQSFDQNGNPLVNTLPQSWGFPSRVGFETKSRGQARFNLAQQEGWLRLYLSEASRIKTDAGLYERKEVDTELNDQYGLKSAMSLDGIFSPVSFYPTFNNSTFFYTKHDTYRCPFCSGTKIIKDVPIIGAGVYNQAGQTSLNIPPHIQRQDLLCDKCWHGNEKLSVTLKGKSSGGSSTSEKLPPYIITSGTDFATLLEFKKNSDPSTGSSTSLSTSIPINLISLNPIMISREEFRNTSAQSYNTEYKDVHGNLTPPNRDPRVFRDRGENCIEIIARGAVPPSEYKYRHETSKNLLKTIKNSNNQVQYHDKDLALYNAIVDLEYNGDKNRYPDINQKIQNYRFFSLRGPLVLHGWGYDTEGYPVPNAADEPYTQDPAGIPLRFALKITIDSTPIDIEKAIRGESYVLAPTYTAGMIIYGVPYNDNKYTSTDEQSNPETATRLNEIHNQFPSGTTVVYKIKIEDDLSKLGGFSPGKPYDLLDGYKGSIISKTQKWDAVAKKWSAKKKMKEFHLHWGERPDLWPVGPIDLRWDANRRVWTTGSGQSSTYKMVYITLEEDLIKEEDFVETYPTRGFLDDIEYSKETLPKNARRLVYVKDRSGFTAPKGTKLLCRYDIDTGFYEPISKPTISTTGKILVGNQVNINMNYVQGRKAGEIPTFTTTFDNPLRFSLVPDKIGIFTYIAGKWTLTAVQQD